MINPFLPAAILSLAAVSAFTLLPPVNQGDRPIKVRGPVERPAVVQPAAGAPATAATWTPTAILSGTFTIAIDGTKQGLFKGESPAERQKDKMVGLRYFHEIKSPRDIATGQASGKRQHGAITITKEVGGASPQIFTALTTNEVLKTVTFEFTRANQNGENYVSYSVKLTNATISNLKQVIEDGKLLEEVSFTYQKIEVACPPAKTMAADDWHTNG